MTEVPEHLLQRAAEARARLGGEGAPAAEAAAAGSSGESEAAPAAPVPADSLTDSARIDQPSTIYVDSAKIVGRQLPAAARRIPPALLSSAMMLRLTLRGHSNPRVARQFGLRMM